MQLTKATEQASCIVALLTIQDKNIPISSDVLHHRLGGSQTYLQKIMRKLVVAGIVTSVSGNNGGFTLTKEPADISVYDVYQAIEGEISTYPDFGFFTRVFADVEPYGDDATKIVQGIYSEADDKWQETLKGYTIDKVCQKLFNVVEIPVLDWNQSIYEPNKFIESLKAVAQKLY